MKLEFHLLNLCPENHWEWHVWDGEEDLIFSKHLICWIKSVLLSTYNNKTFYRHLVSLGSLLCYSTIFFNAKSLWLWVFVTQASEWKVLFSEMMSYWEWHVWGGEEDLILRKRMRNPRESKTIMRATFICPG